MIARALAEAMRRNERLAFRVGELEGVLGAGIGTALGGGLLGGMTGTRAMQQQMQQMSHTARHTAHYSALEDTWFISSSAPSGDPPTVTTTFQLGGLSPLTGAPVLHVTRGITESDVPKPRRPRRHFDTMAARIAWPFWCFARLFWHDTPEAERPTESGVHSDTEVEP